MKITHIEVVSLAKIMGAVYAALGLIGGVFFTLFSLLGLMRDSGTPLIGMLSIILLPLVYGVMGFFSGVITAFIFNFVVKYTGGLEITTE